MNAQVVTSYVYLIFLEPIGGVTFVKVGKSNKPRLRLTNYVTDCPLRIQSVYTARFRGEDKAFAAELSILRRLSHLRHKGEWLRLHEDWCFEHVFEAAHKVAPHLKKYSKFD